MKKGKTLKLIVALILVIGLVIVDFILHGILGDYPLIIGFIVCFITYLKLEIDPKVYLGVAIFLLLSEFFFAVYKMVWILHRIGAWVYFILLFIVLTEIIDLVKKKG